MSWVLKERLRRYLGTTFDQEPNLYKECDWFLGHRLTALELGWGQLGWEQLGWEQLIWCSTSRITAGSDEDIVLEVQRSLT